MTEIYSKARLPTEFGEFDIYIFREDNLEHAALVMPWNEEPVLVRVHSKCITGEVFGSLKCDCGEQLQIAREMIGKEGGMLIYLDQEGRGIGLGNKMRIYKLQEEGYDTVDSMLKLGFEEDPRDFSVAADIIQQFDVSSVRLLTNNPEKMDALRKAGIKVERVPIKGQVNEHNYPYLEAKEIRMGHILDLRNSGTPDILKRKRRERRAVKPPGGNAAQKSEGKVA